jgi:hypothetical protein
MLFLKFGLLSFLLTRNETWKHLGQSCEKWKVTQLYFEGFEVLNDPY